jgi:hypothetical protein
MVSLMLTQYYFYAYNLLPTPCGLLTANVPPVYPFECRDAWSLPFTSEDSLLQPKPERSTQDAPTQSASPVLHSESSCPPKRRISLEEADLRDAFTEKRNIIPNNINHILAYVQRRSKSEREIERIIARLSSDCARPPCSFSSRRFYAYQLYLKGKIDIHVSKKTLALVVGNLDLHSEIFSPDEQLFYNRVCRTAIAHYLRRVAAITTLNSRRLRETSKKDHLRAQRHLLHFIQNI